MSDPRQPLEESQQPVSTTSEPSDRTWSQRGAWRGCFDGRQTLAISFWLLGVGVTVLLTAAGRLIAEILPFDAFVTVTLCTTLAIIATRMLAWYSIIKCRRNTSSPVFTALALSLVSLDIVYGVFRWPAMLAAMMIA